MEKLTECEFIAIDEYEYEYDSYNHHRTIVALQWKKNGQQLIVGGC